HCGSLGAVLVGLQPTGCGHLCETVPWLLLESDTQLCHGQIEGLNPVSAPGVVDGGGVDPGFGQHDTAVATSGTCGFRRGSFNTFVGFYPCCQFLRLDYGSGVCCGVG